jgi:hypothetical protein
MIIVKLKQQLISFLLLRCQLTAIVIQHIEKFFFFFYISFMHKGEKNEATKL